MRTRWLFMLLLCSCFVNVPDSLADATYYGVGKCKGYERGYVAFDIKPDGTVLYYIADRPIPEIVLPKHLTCVFEVNMKVQLSQDAPL